MRIIVFVTLVLLFEQPSLAQKEIRRLTLYFGVNEYGVQKEDLQRAIDSSGLTLESLRSSAKLVAITGYTDCSGEVIYNRILSVKRAKATAAIWKSLTGVEATMVTGQGEGSCHPLESGYVDSKRRVVIGFGLEVRDTTAKSYPENDFRSASSAEVGTILPITDLNFFGGRHFPLVKSYEVLDELVRIMKDNPTLVIEIQGHVCCGTEPTADGMDNDTGENLLSYNRAKFVNDHLLKNGIEQNRMTYKGYAQTRPLPITLKDPGLEILNRRVEIMIVSK